MGADVNLGQGTEILRLTVMRALRNGTANVLVCGFVHCFSPRFLLGSFFIICLRTSFILGKFLHFQLLNTYSSVFFRMGKVIIGNSPENA